MRSGWQPGCWESSIPELLMRYPLFVMTRWATGALLLVLAVPYTSSGQSRAAGEEAKKAAPREAAPAPQPAAQPAPAPASSAAPAPAASNESNKAVGRSAPRSVET